MLIPIKYNIRYLMNRWSGTLMTAFTFALVVATFIIVMSLERGIERALMTTGDPLNVIVMRPGAQAEGQSVVTKAQYQIVRNFPGIAKDEKGEALIVPELIVLANKPKQPDGKSSNLMIRGVHLASLKMRPAVAIVAGRMFKPGLREAVVSRAASKRFQNLNLGDTPQLGRGKWIIVGIFEAKGSAYDSELWTDYQELMQEFDRDAYSTLFLRAIDP
ncbi:MAG: ABC transporter permease, partial [Candidatus Sumerlaeota bacterium]|nr:ABC transporter permease [Candidatus Sumerlaeota bacterium]